MGRVRGEATFCPSEVVRQMYPQDWGRFMEDVRQEMMDMYREGLVTVSQKGLLIDPNSLPKGPVRIRRIDQNKV
jgi:hypothetical protein